MPQHQTSRSASTLYKEKEPPLWGVTLHNDDETTMEFVVDLLHSVFFLSPERSEELMLRVHYAGKALVGTYPRDIAESKTAKSIAMARAEGFPLMVTCGPVEG